MSAISTQINFSLVMSILNPQFNFPFLIFIYIKLWSIKQKVDSLSSLIYNIHIVHFYLFLLYNKPIDQFYLLLISVLLVFYKSKIKNK